MTFYHALCVLRYPYNPFTSELSGTLPNASEKTFYQITHTIHLLETTHKIVSYGQGKREAKNILRLTTSITARKLSNLKH